jgi:hypothetical protein
MLCGKAEPCGSTRVPSHTQDLKFNDLKFQDLKFNELQSNHLQ